MAIQKRQSNLYSGEDWKQVYEAFRVINLQAYDFDTIRESMIQYLRNTYPDSFNNWIENDEFIFILDTISFLGQNLAFRMDLNTRENFLDTAERRSSVLKIAKMISYSPRRSFPARGLAKINEIMTDQDIKNSSGKQLQNVPIKWNDPLDPDWQENFFLVINSTFISSNQFGDPIKKGVQRNVTSSLYRLNSVPMSSPVIGFDTVVNGKNMLMEIVNPDINPLGYFEERNPDPMMQQHIIYRNDGNGFSSPDTGFFVFIKQGSLAKSDYVYSQPYENRTQIVPVNNINELDVWVQEITDDGTVRVHWSKVPAIESVAYNSMNRQLKNIFSVTTLENDQIMIKFPDARSGNVPRGKYRVWYRTGNAETYNIKTTDIQGKTVKFKFRSKDQSKYQTSNLQIKFSLQYQIRNAQESESVEQIKNIAPQMYYTQNRFVTGEDYNIAPLSLGNTVLKAKAINRIYSGQSRFIDMNDPVGKYQNTDIFSDDGAIYKDYKSAVKTNTLLLPTNKSPSSIVIDDLQPLLSDTALIQRYQELPASSTHIMDLQTWNSEYNSMFPTNTYGHFTNASGNKIVYKTGTLIEVEISNNNTTWMSVIDSDNETYMVLSDALSSGTKALTYIREFRTKFTNDEIKRISTFIDKKSDFILVYNKDIPEWIAIDGNYDDVETVFYENSTYTILLRAHYNADSWDFKSYGVDFIFVGGEKVKFFFVNKDKISDISTGSSQNDKINVLAYNYNPTTNTQYSSNINFQIVDTMSQENGYLDGSRAIISSNTMDVNGIPLNPRLFDNLVPTYSTEADKARYSDFVLFKTNKDFSIEYIQLPNKMVTFYDTNWKYTLANANAEQNSYKREKFIKNVTIRSNSLSDLYNKSIGFIVSFKYNDSTYYFEQIVSNNNDRLSNLLVNTGKNTVEEAFYTVLMNMSNPILNDNLKLDYYGYKNVSSEYSIKENARTGINFQWKHYAPDDNRIDPSRTNLIDMYVLTNSYKTEVELWVKNGAVGNFPRAPTSTELQDMFNEVESKIVISDSIIWNSAKYLPLFGNSTDEDYKANFKVVRTASSKLSDDEIRQKVIELTNKFFDLENWDFGESFYFTELSTYIHQNLSTEIASIVIVPQNPNSKFGELFEIPADSDQLFISTATVNNVYIVNSLAKTNINIGS